MKNEFNSQEINLLDIQNIATFLYIISLLISIYLTNYDKETLENKPHSCSPTTYQRLAIFNRVFVITLTLTYLYINYANQNIARQKKEDLSSFRWQISASWLSLVATLIALYVVVHYQNYTTISGIENPGI